MAYHFSYSYSYSCDYSASALIALYIPNEAEMIIVCEIKARQSRRLALTLQKFSSDRTIWELLEEIAEEEILIEFPNNCENNDIWNVDSIRSLIASD